MDEDRLVADVMRQVETLPESAVRDVVRVVRSVLLTHDEELVAVFREKERRRRELLRVDW